MGSIMPHPTLAGFVIRSVGNRKEAGVLFSNRAIGQLRRVYMNDIATVVGPHGHWISDTCFTYHYRLSPTVYLIPNSYFNELNLPAA